MNAGPKVQIQIREAIDADSAAVIALLGAVYAEYPGCVLDVANEAPHLRQPASAFRAWRGRFWVGTNAGTVVACVGFRDDGDPVELKHLYVAARFRRIGVARQLVGVVESEARRRGRAAIELWTDSRFEAAHRFYERLGYLRSERSRELHDLSSSIEYHYRRRL